MNFTELHNHGLEIVDRYKKSEAEVLSIFQKLDQTKTYLHYNCTSLFDYSIKFHKLSESVTLNFIAVSRRAVQLPELKAAIDTGDLTISKARKITSVITPETQSSWISKAINLSSRALEKEVAKVQPQVLTPEKAKYVTETRVNINFGLSEEFYKKLKRIQDLESQRLSRAVSLEEAQEVMIDLYLERKDPVKKAKRNVGKTKKDCPKPDEHVPGHIDNFSDEIANPTAKPQATSATKASAQNSNQVTNSLEKPPAKTSTKTSDQVIKSLEEPGAENIQKPFTSRTPIPSQLRHQVNLRDQGKCSEPGCNQERWLETHHIIPVSQGGQNTLENLKTLCFSHHKLEHLELGNEFKH